MAIEGNQARNSRKLPGLACIVPYLAGMILIYIGERLAVTPLSLRLILDGTGAACLLWALFARLFNRAGTTGEHRTVEGMLLLGYLGGLFALVLYAAQLETVFKELIPWLEEPKAIERYRVILQVLWPIVWISAITPLLFMEISYAAMVRAPQIERRRVAFSAVSGLSIAWLFTTLFVVNYIADVHNRKWDLTYQRISSPSEDVSRLISSLQETFEVILFFPAVNEVREEVLSYLQELTHLSDHFQIRILDRDLEPIAAKELGVRKNGTMVCRYGDKNESIRLGLTIDQARAQLNKIDQELSAKFFRLVVEEKIVYFTTGHGERPYDYPPDKDDHRSPVNNMKSILLKQNFEIKPLGLGQGLGSEVPDDASLLFVIDPTEDFLPEEIETIDRYLKKGGAAWIILDPEQSSNISGLAGDYGIIFNDTTLANDQFHIRAHHNKADRYNLITNETSSHPSVTSLSRSRGSRMAVILPETGYLEKSREKKAGDRVIMTLRSMPGTWPDNNRNMEPDVFGEERKIYDLGAAVSMPVIDKASDKVAGAEPSSEDKKEMRMLVLADGDALSDKWIRNLGNFYLFDDGLKWLFQEKRFVGAGKSEEDVRIVHTRESDVVWFYGTIFAAPLLVLGIGIFYNQLRTRLNRKSEKG